MQNKKKILFGITGVILTLVLICLILGISFLRKMLYEHRNEYSETTDINLFTGREGLLHWDEYEEYFSYLLSFPENTEDINVEEFFYRTENCAFDTTYHIFLRYTMSEEKYDMEKERLASVSLQYNGEEKTPIYIEGVYEKPIYLLACTCTEVGVECYEYAILDDEKQEIVCVFIQLDALEDTKIPSEYLIDEQLILERISGEYTMYYFQTGELSSAMPKLEE